MLIWVSILCAILMAAGSIFGNPKYWEDLRRRSYWTRVIIPTAAIVIPLNFLVLYTLLYMVDKYP